MWSHYTSVPNIMKVINPLFLDDLNEEFEENIWNNKKLNALLERLSKIKFFDPACWSGNFLIIAYKEIRRLETEILKEIWVWPLTSSNISLSQFYWIELNDFAHETAKLSLYLAEHQMNVEFYNETWISTVSLPLKLWGNIVCWNATRLDWEAVCPKQQSDEIYIMWNPPYIWRRNQSKEQKEEIANVLWFLKNHRSLDYISIWFYKWVKYIEWIEWKISFVSTNSIVQWELVSLLWPYILEELNMEIVFVYSSFKWTNNAKNNAGVTVVIIWISNYSDKNSKFIYINNKKISVKNINSYLIDWNSVYIQNRSKSISWLPEMSYWNMPWGCTELFLSLKEKEKLIFKYPQISKYIKRLIWSQESIKSIEKYCLWFKWLNLDDDIFEIEEIKEKLLQIKENRKWSKDSSYNKLIDTPHLFRDLKETKDISIIIPIVSSEKRKYIPISLVNSNSIVPNSAQVIYDVDIWIMWIVISNMHMVWTRSVAWKLEERFRYSRNVVYNTFPFPYITKKQKAEIEEYVYEVLDEREKHSEKTLAEMYDPDKMPEWLREAHHQLDLAIERCYRPKPFESDEERLEYLFKMYEKMIVKENESLKK